MWFKAEHQWLGNLTPLVKVSGSILTRVDESLGKLQALLLLFRPALLGTFDLKSSREQVVLVGKLALCVDAVVEPVERDYATVLFSALESLLD